MDLALSPLVIGSRSPLTVRESVVVDDDHVITADEVEQLLFQLRERALRFLQTRYGMTTDRAEDLFARVSDRIRTRIESGAQLPVKALNPYLIRSLTNLWFRQYSQEQRVVAIDDAQDVGSPWPAHSADPDALDEALNDCVEGLPSLLKGLVRLKYWVGKQLGEFAADHRLNRPKVARLHTQALRLILDCLMKKGFDISDSRSARLVHADPSRRRR